MEEAHENCTEGYLTLLLPMHMSKCCAFFYLQYFQTCLWKSLRCFCVVQWSHPVASWVNHICVFPMDMWGSLFQELLLVYYDSLESNSIAEKQVCPPSLQHSFPKVPGWSKWRSRPFMKWIAEEMKAPGSIIFLKLEPLSIMSWCFKRMIQGEAETKIPALFLCLNSVSF